MPRPACSGPRPRTRVPGALPHPGARRGRRLWSSDPRSGTQLAALVADACRDLARTPDPPPGRAARPGPHARTSTRSPGCRPRPSDDIDLQWRSSSGTAELGGAPDEDSVRRLLDATPTPTPGCVALGRARRDADGGGQGGGSGRRDRGPQRADLVGGLGDHGVLAPGHAELLRRTPRAISTCCPDLHAGGMIPAMVNTRRLFPLFGIDADYLARSRRGRLGCAHRARDGCTSAPTRCAGCSSPGRCEPGAVTRPL